MKFEEHYKNSKLFFVGSWLLLLGFVGFWLQGIYQDKLEEWRTNLSLYWVKSVEGVERQKMITMVQKGAAYGVDSLFSPKMLHLPDKAVYGELRQENHQQEINGSRTTIATSIIIKDSVQSSSILDSSFLNMLTSGRGKTTIQTTVESSDSVTAAELDWEVFQYLQLDIKKVQAAFEALLEGEGLLVNYQIKSLGREVENNPKDPFMTKTLTGEQYTLVVTPNTSYLLQQMGWEFCFAFLLLFIIAAAFYYNLYHLRKQQELVLLKQDLISNMTHELRTPIFTVSAALEALDSFKGLENPTRTQEYLDISKKEVERLASLVEQVLHTTLLGREALHLEVQEIAIEPWLKGIVQTFQIPLEQQEASLEWHLDNPHLTWKIDPLHWSNVVYNLLDNALKYRTTTPPHIVLAIQESASTIQLKVQDNGRGIPSAYVGQVFEQFFRVPQGDQHTIKGYGLGLHYVQMIVQQHEGSIQVQSQEGEGTTFIITLPKAS